MYIPEPGVQLSRPGMITSPGLGLWLDLIFVPLDIRAPGAGKCSHSDRQKFGTYSLEGILRVGLTPGVSLCISFLPHETLDPPTL
jgi:hypothetical protein